MVKKSTCNIICSDVRAKFQTFARKKNIMLVSLLKYIAFTYFQIKAMCLGDLLQGNAVYYAQIFPKKLLKEKRVKRISLLC